MSDELSLASIGYSLYSTKPSRVLYHYTGYQALLGIAHTTELWASDIHYFNDSSELKYAARIFGLALTNVTGRSTYPPDLVNQLRTWLDMRLADGHSLYVVCFTEAGNLLSQWRGYAPHGNGISLGFDPGFLETCAAAQEFQIARCIYSRDHQDSIASQAIEVLLNRALTEGPKGDAEAHPSQSYYVCFYALEALLLSIAALLKNPAFEEEQEWRAVSTVQPSYLEHPARYRVGRNMLIPYKPFSLRPQSDSSMQVEHVFLGPTSENNLAMRALSQFLASHRMNPNRGVTASQLPYRMP